MDRKKLFSDAATLMENSDWWRGWDNWYAEHGEGTDIPENLRCVWQAVGTAYSLTADKQGYQLGPVLSHDLKTTNKLREAIKAVDPVFFPDLDVHDLHDVFRWNDDKALSKEQIVLVLRTAAELAEANE